MAKRKTKRESKEKVPRKKRRTTPTTDIVKEAAIVCTQPAIDDGKSIDCLPNELLNIVFSHLDVKTLFFVVRLVCKQWYQISMSPVLWKRIQVHDDVPTKTLTKWIQSSGLLEELSMENRNDANLMTELVSKNCKRLQKIRLINCWGSTQNPSVHSLPLCHLITRCQRLNNLNFARTKFSSCKFFKLLSNIKITGHVAKSCCYYGPINEKQIMALLMTLRDHQVKESASIGNCNIKQMFNVMGMINYEGGVYSPNNGGIIEDICANLLFISNSNEQNSIHINI